MAHFGALWARALSLRTVVLAAALALALGVPLTEPIRSWQTRIDAALFQIALSFGSPPVPSQSITVVHVPDLEYDRWLQDLGGSQTLLQLLSTPPLHKTAPPAVFGLLAERPISFIKPAAESHLETLKNAGVTIGSHELEPLLTRRDQLVALLSSSVVVGVPEPAGAEVPPLTVAWEPALQAPQWLVERLWPLPPAPVFAEVAAGPVARQYPLLESQAVERRLAFSRDGVVYPEFVLGFLQAAQAQASPAPAGAEPPIRWVRNQGFVIGEAFYPASTGAEVVPSYGGVSDLRASLRQITLKAALEMDGLPGWVLVGRDGSELLAETAQTLAAMAEGAVLYEPYWWSPAEKALAALLGLLLIAAVPMMRATQLLQLALTVTVLLAGGTAAAQLTQDVWLPVGDLLLFWWLGTLLMLAWRHQRSRLNTLASRADRVSIEHATLLVQSYRLPEAFAALQPCHTSPRLLQHLYRLATLQREQGFAKDALVSFEEIKHRRRRYKDVEEQIQRLKQAIAETERHGSTTLARSQGDALHRSGSTLDSTQALPGVPQGQRTIGRYEILEELGRGSSGTVYLAHDPRIAREVALKTLNYHLLSGANVAEVKARFFREAIAAGRLHHPNIVQVFDVGEEGQLAYIAMDYAKGKPLSDYIHHLLPVDVVYRVAIEVADALAYAHSQRVIHRDIKPSNIVFNAEPFQVRVMDFGIARIIDYAQTSDSKILGSPLYMAPEQLLGHESGPAADIFSLGVMLYQLLTGQLPFAGDNLASLSYEIVHTQPKSVLKCRGDLPASANKIIARALQKRPQDRFTSADEMAEALRQALVLDVVKDEQHDLIA